MKAARKAWIVRALGVAVGVAVGCGGAEVRTSERADIVARGAELVVVRVPDLGAVAAADGTKIRRRELYLKGVLERGVSGRDLAVAFGELGKVYQAYGFPESALDAYRNARSLDATDFRWPYYLARAYDALSNGEEAARAASWALELRPEDLATLIFLGDTYLELRRPDEAETFYQRASGVAPGVAAAWYGRGRIAMSRKDFARAVECFEASLAAQPKADVVHYPLALAYRGLGDLERAEEHMARRGQVLPAVPDPLMDALGHSNPHTVARRGLDALRAGRPEVAVLWLEKARRLAPEDFEVRLNLGAALTRLGRPRRALGSYREALRLRPENPRTHFNLGTTLASLGEDDEALAALRRAVELNGDYRQAHFNLGQILQRLGHDQEALVHLDEVLRIDPRHLSARISRARLLARRGECAAAITALERSRQLFPDDRTLPHVLSRLLATCEIPSWLEPPGDVDRHPDGQ
ncbi:MAG: tetratricopeptide repeat protein, partial [Planctomycetes bacterium]|nr:tetratricopeptide repeat protein [Planctomycetota bacterium]